MKTTNKQKSVYKLSNWSSYNQALVNRGNLCFWLSDDLVSCWHHTGPQLPGGSVVYSDQAIETCLTLRALFGLGYRQTQGFISSLFVPVSYTHLTLPTTSRV